MDHRDGSIAVWCCRCLDFWNWSYYSDFPLPRHIRAAEGKVDQVCQATGADRGQEAQEPCRQVVSSLSSGSQVVQHMEDLDFVCNLHLGVCCGFYIHLLVCLVSRD